MNTLRYNWDRWNWLHVNGMDCRVCKDHLHLIRGYRFIVEWNSGDKSITYEETRFKTSDDAKRAFEAKIDRLKEIFKDL